MKHGMFLPAAAFLFAVGVSDTLAADRGHRDGWRGDRGGRGDWRGDRHRGGNRHAWRGGDHRWRGDRHWSYRHHHFRGWPSWVAPRYYGSAPYPRWLYAPPYPRYSYSAPVYAPLYVERVYEPAPVYVERVYEEPRQYAERSYAQVTPSPPPAREAQPAPPPRLQRQTLSATELFEFDSATLRRPQPRLDEIAAALARNPRIDNVTITGHTDRLGSDAYNLTLSQRRADAVKAYLVGKGVAANRLEAIGKGEANPVVQCNQKDRAALIKCLEPNRRVEQQITIEQRSTR